MPMQPRTRVTAAAVAACLAFISFSPRAAAQTAAATFGEVAQLGYTPADIVLDEARGRLYLVNNAASRVDVYDYNLKRLLSPVKVGTAPLAAAMDMSGTTLYVTNSGEATLSEIDLGTMRVRATITLPARPEGVEVGYDGRVLICTLGSGVNNANNTLLVYDKSQTGAQVFPVQFAPPPPTPTTLPATQSRPTTRFRGKLGRTPDGKFIIGMSVVNNNSSTYAYIYEVDSGVIIKSRQVSGQSTVLAVNPVDGSRFMAGFTMYDTATLAVVAQQSTANAPFPMPGSFNTVANIGGSAFSPDGTTLYSAFNMAANTLPAPRPQSSILLISDTRHLGFRLGIRLPESIIAKMVLTSAGDKAWGLSESGLIYLPLDKLFDYPIIMPESTQVFLAQDECHKGFINTRLQVNNIGKGKLTVNVPTTGGGLIVSTDSGTAPATLTFTMDSGRTGVIRQAGTNLTTNGGITGSPLSVNLASSEAINIPPTIRVYMNYRLADMRGLIYPIPTVIDNSQGLLDLHLDETRGRLYIVNSGFNRIEIFDTQKLKFLEPIQACQLPRQMAVASDGLTMYVACQGSEGIAIIDLEKMAKIGDVEFPPYPRSGNSSPVTPETLALGVSGLQFILNNGTVWRVVGNQAVPITPNSILGMQSNGAQQPISSPRTMVASPDYASVLLLGGSGMGYLYDAVSNAWVQNRQLFSTPIVSYYGPLAISPVSNFMVANGLILNNSLSVIGGSERPGVTQTTSNPIPGQPPIVTVVSAGLRNVAAVAPVDGRTVARMTTPVRQSITATTRDEVRTTLETYDITSATTNLVGVMPENPVNTVFGSTRVNVRPKMMVVDSAGTTAYTITLSGLSVVSLAAATTANRPLVPQGVRGVVNSSDGTTNLQPGSFITITGQNLAAPAEAGDIPLPTVLGGSCVVFNDVALPLISTSAGQISAQLPENLRPGLYVVYVRSLNIAQQSDPLVVTVRKP